MLLFLAFFGIIAIILSALELMADYCIPLFVLFEVILLVVILPRKDILKTDKKWIVVTITVIAVIVTAILWKFFRWL